jgi:hypothetical protein
VDFNWEDVPNAITAITTLIAAIGALVVTLRNGQKANDAKVAAEAAKVIAAEKGAAAVAAAEAAKTAAEEGRAIMISTSEGVFELGKRVDGRLSELLALTKASAKAEGRLEADADAKRESKPGPVPVEIVKRAEELAPLKVEQVTSKPPPATDKGRA